MALIRAHTHAYTSVHRFENRSKLESNLYKTFLFEMIFFFVNWQRNRKNSNCFFLFIKFLYLNVQAVTIGVILFSNFNREYSFLHLFMPFFDPSTWANIFENLFKIVARFVFLSTQFLASIEIDEGCGAVNSLVGIRKPRIKRSAEWQLLF